MSADREQTVAEDVAGNATVDADAQPTKSSDTPHQADGIPPVNESRRYFLIGATSAVSAVGVGFVAVPFLKSWSPSAKARAAGAPVVIDISKLRENSMLGPIPTWRGTPVFVVKRDAATVERLQAGSAGLADPDSENVDQQPDYAVNVWRSRKPEVGVYRGICTHLGCSPKYHGKVQSEPFDANWQGGFFCPCHGSKFDLAGRVVAGLPAPDNLEVPPHSYLNDSELIIGVDEENS
jgi:ubiquinol-cytochrome c reductase iron-sulfur subunit